MIAIDLKRRQNDLGRYISIKKQYNSSVDLENNLEFQKTYKTFYVMNATGLTDKYFKKYFKLLNTRKFNSQDKLSDFLIKLDGIPTRTSNNSMQLAFATKALHTINNKLPIYDKHIANFFQLAQIPNDTKNNLSDRIIFRQSIYNELVDKFNCLLSGKEIADLIKEAQDFFADIKDINEISDTKMLDFIIWTYGSIK